MLHWRDGVLNRISFGNAKDVAALALEALERIDRARAKSRKGLKGQVSYDFRLGATVVR